MKYLNLNIIVLLLLSAAVVNGRTIRLYDIWTGQPVAGALVYTADDTLVSNSSGYVKLTDKTDSVVIAAENYYTEKVDITALEKPLIYLEPLDYSETITVVRSAEPDSRLSIPTHITHINVNTADDFRPVERLLDAQSGIVIKSYGGYGQIQTISLRGMSAAQTQTLLDGIPLNNLQMGNMDFSTVSVNALRGIDIYRGGNYLFGGSGAIGGVVNFQTVNPQDYFSYNFFYQNASWNNHLFSGRVDLPVGIVKQSIFFEKSFGDNNYNVWDGQKNVELQNRDFNRYHFNYKNDIPINDNNHLEFFVSTYKNSGGAPTAFIDGSRELSNLARMHNDNTLSKVKYKHFHKNSNWSLQAFVHNSWMEYGNPILVIRGRALNSIHFNSEKGLQARWNTLFGNKLLLHAGLDGALQSVNSSEAGIHRRSRLSAYGITDWLITDKWLCFRAPHLNAAARLESYSDFGVILLPSVSLSAALQNVNLYISGGKNYRAPAFNDLYWQPGGNPDLTAERSVNYEFGADYRQSIASFILFLNGSLYMNDVSRQIKWLPHGLYWQPQNIASVLSRGVEIQLGAEDVNRIHKVSFNYSYGTSVKNSADFAGDNNVGNQLPFIPKEKWALNISSGLRKFRCGLRTKWDSFRYTTMGNDSYLPSYYLLDIYASFAFKVYRQKIELYFTLNNILDTRYEVMSGYPMPPRNYRISLRFSGKP